MKKTFYLSVILILCGLQVLLAQTSSIDFTTPIATDPNVRTGQLPNGLKYYIRKNHKPEKRLELRLAVNAGSVLENDDQQGLAHFMEHMNFNGTKTFPKNELINFLQKTGVQFGADINAYTGFDETVYMLQLPTDDSTLVETGFQVLEDWAHNASLDNDEIDKERGVITEEWRLGLGADDRMRKEYFPIIFKDSKYADRIPIGKPEIIKDFKYETLKQFYKDWYRPDLQSVVVVGDIDPDKVEARIKEHFSRIPAVSNPRKREVYDLPGNKEPLIAVATDKEATNNMVLLFYKHQLNEEKTLQDFRKNLMTELFTEMLNNRFNEIAQQPDAPFVMAGSQYGRFLVRTKDAYLVYCMPKENDINKAIEVILQENERVKRFGFTPGEFERQKEEIFSRYEKAAKEADKTESSVFAGNYVANFLTHDPIPGAQKEFKYVKNILPTIKAEEINALAGELVTADNMALVVTAPEKPDNKVPGKEEISKIISEASKANVTAYVDNYKEEPLISNDLKGSTVVSKTEKKDLGYTELVLSNGVKVNLKPTNFKNDEILISAFSPGGNSLYPDDKFISSMFATQIVDQSGIGNFDYIQLQKKLKGKNLTITPYIDDVKEGFTGNASPKDMETLMQLVYLYFTSPRKDTSAYKAFISQMENQMKFIKSNPVYTFYDSLYKSAYPGSKRVVVIPSVDQIHQIKLDESLSIYKDRFADASDFTFTVVGNFNIDSITPMIAKYFGSLPSTKRNETWKDVHPEFAKGVNNHTIFKGADPQTMVGIVMSEPISFEPSSLLQLSMLKEIISIKLIEVIREKLSGVYSPQVVLDVEHYPVSNYKFIVMFGCSPVMADSLTGAVFAEIEKLRKDGPTEVDLQKAKETLIRARETDIEKNSFWLSKIESVYFDKTDPQTILNFADRVNAVTVQDLQKTAEKNVNPQHYVRVVLMPEQKQ